MVNRYLFILLLSLLPASPAVADKFFASVDTTSVSEGEPIELTLRSDKQEFFNSPDLSPLAEHFDIVSQHQSSQFNINNGKSISWTDWVITLVPKRNGFVVIPPLTLDGMISEPIGIQVKKANEHKNPGEVAPIFIESSVDIDESYVQQQIIYTIRILHSVALFDDSKLSELKIDNVILQSLGEVNAYTEIIDGKRHGVFELRYAIYPQKSGELIIPSQTFKATTAAPRKRYEPFLNSRRGKKVSVNAPEIRIQVKPIPQEAQAKHWIPAHDLSIDESWSQSLDTLTVGDSITRTIKLKAEGLTFAQLPLIETPELDKLKTYPDKPQGENLLNLQGIDGRSSQATAFVATRPGTYILPSTEFQWFDTDSESLQTIVLEERTLVVAPLPNQEITTKSVEPIAEESPVISPAEQTPPLNPVVEINTVELTKWKLASGIFFALWLITLLWATLRKRPIADPGNAITTEPQPTSGDEKICFEQLIKVITKGHDQHLIHDSLKRWLRRAFDAPSHSTLDELCALTNSAQIVNYANQLQKALYHDGHIPSIAPKELSAVIQGLRKQLILNRKKPASSLKKLYG